MSEAAAIWIVYVAMIVTMSTVGHFLLGKDHRWYDDSDGQR